MERRKGKEIKINPKFPNCVMVDDNDIPIYDSIEHAIREIFNLAEYSLIRVTRAAALEPEGAIVLKLETARPGDKHLNDDEFDTNIIPPGDDKSDLSSGSKNIPSHNHNDSSAR
ncbi:unnamed protein product [[Candida] boidinii]|nr:unnamed protein product [[Candida] boidinii]